MEEKITSKKTKIIIGLGILFFLLVFGYLFYNENLILGIDNKDNKLNDLEDGSFELSPLFENLEPYQEVVSGDPVTAEAILIYVQQGSLFPVDSDLLTKFTDIMNFEDIALINVYQEQNLYPEKFVKDITFEEAIEYDKESLKILSDLVRYYLEEDKKVYIVGVSFGAFMVSKLLADQGILANGYLLLAGRLNIQKQVWESLSRGKHMKFDYDHAGFLSIVDAYEDKVDMKNSAENRNMARLSAGFMYQPYMDLLKDYDLNNVVYGYGLKDQQVGKLETEEIDFLKKRKAKIIGIDAGHEKTILTALQSGLRFLPEFEIYLKNSF